MDVGIFEQFSQAILFSELHSNNLPSEFFSKHLHGKCLDISQTLKDTIAFTWEMDIDTISDKLKHMAITWTYTVHIHIFAYCHQHTIPNTYHVQLISNKAATQIRHISIQRAWSQCCMQVQVHQVQFFDMAPSFETWETHPYLKKPARYCPRPGRGLLDHHVPHVTLHLFPLRRSIW